MSDGFIELELLTCCAACFGYMGRLPSLVSEKQIVHVTLLRWIRLDLVENKKITLLI